MNPPEARSPGWLAGNWVALGLWMGLAAGCSRAGVLYVMDVVEHAAEPELARLRLAEALPGILLRASALGCAIGAGAALVSRARVALVRRGGLVALWLGAGWGCFALLSGRLAEDASRQVGTGTARGASATQVLALAAALLAAALVLAVARSLRSGRAPGRVGFLLPAALALALPLGWRLVHGRHDARMVVCTPIRSLIEQEDAFEVVAENPRRAPHVGVLCPSADYRIDGADMRALVLPPPAEVRVVLGPEDGPGWLRARAGLDRSAVKRHAQELERHSVRFEVWVDGELAFREDVPVAHVGEYVGSEWVELGAHQGLPVAPGMELRLRTSVVDSDGTQEARPPLIAAGFGGLRLERREHAARTLSAPERPNVVLVVMDTLRADRLSLYGYGRATSPQLDRLAARGLVFDEAHATTSWTWPSTASLLTGMAPEEHGVVDVTACFLADEITTLAEVMQARGLTTAAWSGNPLIVPDKNFDQGFEFFDHGKRGMRKSQVLLPGALDWIEATGDTRFFLYLHMTDPHAPLVPHAEGARQFAAEVGPDFTRKINDYNALLLAGRGHGEAGEVRTDGAVSPRHQQWISDLYDACVWSGDRWLGELFATLERAGLTDRTIVAFTSDHGEELFDHGLVTHGHSLHRELVRVPLVIAGPGIPAGVRVSTPVSNRHLAPTLARLVGGELGDPTDALDLAALGGEAVIPDREVYFSTRKGWWNGRHPQPIFGVRRGPWILHLAPQGAPWGAPPGADGDTRLFHLGTDPLESRDLDVERAALAADLRAALEGRRAERRARRHAPHVPAGEATLEVLRALGYIGDE